MPLVIGVDEAGYGPNLGPLLIAATLWEVDAIEHDFDFYRPLEGVVRNPDQPRGEGLLIGDSKRVYSSSTGLADLELGVLTALAARLPVNPTSFTSGTKHNTGSNVKTKRTKDHQTTPKSNRLLAIGHSPSFLSLLDSLHHGVRLELESEPWFQTDLALPRHNVTDGTLIGRLIGRQQQTGIRLRHVAVDFVLPARFNRLNEESQSKGRTLSELSLRLVRNCLERHPDHENETVVVLADKHGGRSRYQEFLPFVCDDQFIRTTVESQTRSHYRAGRLEFRFEIGSERYLPTALASMVAKYLRELAMELFNNFWQKHIDGLRPTAGYPVDAVRFRREISLKQLELQIPDAVLWRSR